MTGSRRTAPSPTSTTTALDADDFSRLAIAAFLVGRNNDCIQAMQRAYQAHLDRGEVLGAVRCGFWLAMP